jgi:hypothetical protein
MMLSGGKREDFNIKKAFSPIKSQSYSLNSSPSKINYNE